MREVVATINGYDMYPRIVGRVRFQQCKRGVLVTAHIRNLPTDGFFAFHIHEGNNCEEPQGHYNPNGALHPYHAGDLPPLLSNGGEAYMSVLTDRFTLDAIIGRTVIIHKNPDDFRTQPSGDSGDRVACGVIMPSCSNPRFFCERF